VTRYGPEHKAETRQRILESAGRLFRRQGFAATGLQGLMADSNLTVGGFYAHFESKEALFAEVFAKALEKTRVLLLAGLEDTKGEPFVREIARRYLSRAHRDLPADGCAIPALAAELARQSEGTRAGFDVLLEEMLADFEPHLPSSKSLGAKDRALALAALMVGGMTLARAVNDRALSDRILLACRKLAVEGL
jgi:TetR/AcrR family transcriptional regulator, transcriptional repressor for nem operon